jgi:hypothetical protein
MTPGLMAKITMMQLQNGEGMQPVLLQHQHRRGSYQVGPGLTGSGQLQGNQRGLVANCKSDSAGLCVVHCLCTTPSFKAAGFRLAFLGCLPVLV